ncbi:MAG: protein kinase [Acidobacteriota bacterium]|nr:protein kinase [Acidobacteriota bacterium]
MSSEPGSPADQDPTPLETLPYQRASVAGDAADPGSDHLIGKRIGPYRVVQELGHGGMGTVYRALRADEEFQNEVAIKVVSRGLATRFLLDQFRTERQILATLEHPNIARLLDGGRTDEGNPYLVMEFIDGEPLHAYCDAWKLSVSDRLRLFRGICEAVSYAHRHLIIHRDLKPDNILVTSEGVPKLLDFGIAKILERATPDSGEDATLTIIRMGTPAYASPEQIVGAPVGVATDIYSLGVILYELLTGRRPYRITGSLWEDTVRTVCEREPTRPSAVITSGPLAKADAEQISRSRGTTIDALRKRLSGDLDNILAVALRKEPNRRYKSVDHLTEDIQRHLDGRPVSARGDSLIYRSHKFIGRHKLATLAAAVFTVSFCVASFFAAWQAHRLSVRVDEDRKLASSFLIIVHDEIAKLPGSTPAREALLTKSVEYLNGLRRYGGSDRQMQRSLALAYERFSDLLSGVDSAGLGKSSQALPAYEAARSIRESLVRGGPGDLEARYELASNYLLGSSITGRVAGVEQRRIYDRKALEISEALVGAAPNNNAYQGLLARAYSAAAYSYSITGGWTQAGNYYRKALRIREHLAAMQPRDSDAHRELALVHYGLGNMQTQSGHPGEALSDLQQALALQTRLLAENQRDPQLRSDLASTHHFLCVTLGATGELAPALAHCEEAISIREATLRTDAHDARTQYLLAGNYAEQSTVLLKSARKAEALASIRRAVDLQQQLLNVDRKGVPTRVLLADYEGRLGGVYSALKEWRNAAQSWTTAVRLYEELDAAHHLSWPGAQHDLEHARAEAARCTRIAQVK